MMRVRRKRRRPGVTMEPLDPVLLGLKCRYGPVARQGRNPQPRLQRGGSGLRMIHRVWAADKRVGPFRSVL